jgi:hypothetical protein
MNWPLLVRAVATRMAEHRLNQQAAKDRQPARRPIWPWIAGLLVVGFPGLTLILVMLLAAAAVSSSAPALAGAGAAGLPPVVFSAYLAAQANASTVAEGCAVEWPVIAGIWKVESGHAASRSIDPTGRVTPPIYGPILDGSTPRTRVVPDTDNGELDGDPVWDRAVGPAQFLPGSWRGYGRDGNGDGIADPHNVFDAALSTVAYLCLRTPGDYHNPDHLAWALRGYNNSTEYVETVTGWIDYYRAFTYVAGAVTADGLYAFPLPTESVTPGQIRRSHHDYPASDLAVPEGTPVYAAHPGTVTAVYTPCPSCTCGYGVTITGHDGHRYTYCHGHSLAIHIQPGIAVGVGEVIMASGNTGNSTTPHLHFQIRNPQGHLVCPQGLLEAWWQGIGLSPIGAPTDGCTH